MQYHYLWKYLRQYIQQPLFHHKHHLHQSRLNKHYHNHNTAQQKYNPLNRWHFHYNYMLLNLDNLQFLIHHKLHLHQNHLNKSRHSYSIVLQKYIGHYQQLCKKNHSYKLTPLNILHKKSIHMNHHHL